MTTPLTIIITPCHEIHFVSMFGWHSLHTSTEHGNFHRNYRFFRYATLERITRLFLIITHNFHTHVTETIARDKIDAFVNGGLERNPGLARGHVAPTKEPVGMVGGNRSVNGPVRFVHGQTGGRRGGHAGLEDQVFAAQEGIENLPGVIAQLRTLLGL